MGLRLDLLPVVVVVGHVPATKSRFSLPVLQENEPNLCAHTPQVHKLVRHFSPSVPRDTYHFRSVRRVKVAALSLVRRLLLLREGRGGKTERAGLMIFADD